MSSQGCGRSVEGESPHVERWAQKTARKHGFTEVAHTMEMYGLCRDCS